MDYKLTGPDGFFRNTFILQETEDSWPVVYVWDGDHQNDTCVMDRWVFKSGDAEQQTMWWDDDPDTYKPKPLGARRPLTYEEWWAFIYWMATNDPQGDNASEKEEQFFKQVLQPQTSKEKSNV